MPRGQTDDKTFKQEAVRFVKTSRKSYRQVANDLGVGMSTLSRWWSELDEHGEKALVGSGNLSRKPRNSNAYAGKMMFYAKNARY